jgi:hypothetical protein
MKAFVEAMRDSPDPLPYRPGKRTKIPNRYYQVRHGNVHCFALDSNSLEHHPRRHDPWKENAAAIVEQSQKTLDNLNDQVQRDRDWEHEETTRQRKSDAGWRARRVVATASGLLSGVVTERGSLASQQIAGPMPCMARKRKTAQRLKALAQQERDLHDRWQKSPRRSHDARRNRLWLTKRGLMTSSTCKKRGCSTLAKRDEFT